MIERKARTFLKLIATIGPFMPLPNNSTKSTSRTIFRKSLGFVRKLYICAFLVSVGIMIACDLHVYRGDTLKYLMPTYFAQ